MAIKDKLNSAWQTNEAMDAVFEFRAQAEKMPGNMNPLKDFIDINIWYFRN